jgi:hypothetical protein
MSKALLGILGTTLAGVVVLGCLGHVADDPNFGATRSNVGSGVHDGGLELDAAQREPDAATPFNDATAYDATGDDALARDARAYDASGDAGRACNWATENGFGLGPPGQSYATFDGGAAGSPGDCSYGSRERCGSEEYAVVCSCPQRTCTCYVGGEAVATGVAPSAEECGQCPIFSYDQLAGACGFPR